MAYALEVGIPMDQERSWGINISSPEREDAVIDAATAALEELRSSRVTS